MDNEPPAKEFYDINRRVIRGLFVSNAGVKINADVNAVYQIIKKAIPDVQWDNGTKAVVLQPVNPAADGYRVSFDKEYHFKLSIVINYYDVHNIYDLNRN